MKVPRRILQSCCTLFVGLGFVWACGYDDSLREYLDVHFWLPFSKRPMHFARNNVRRIFEPYAGMVKVESDTPLAKLRAAYQQVSQPAAVPFDAAILRQAAAAALAAKSLTRREREEAELILAKIDMRSGEPDDEPQRVTRPARPLRLAASRAASIDFSW